MVLGLEEEHMLGWEEAGVGVRVGLVEEMRQRWGREGVVEHQLGPGTPHPTPQHPAPFRPSLPAALPPPAASSVDPSLLCAIPNLLTPLAFTGSSGPEPQTQPSFLYFLRTPLQSIHNLETQAPQRYFESVHFAPSPPCHRDVLPRPPSDLLTAAPAPFLCSCLEVIVSI